MNILLNLNLRDLDSTLKRFYDQSSGPKKTESLRMSLSDSPKLYSDGQINFDPTQFYFGTRRRQDLIVLAIFSWYFPEEIRILFQLDLAEHWEKCDKFYEVKEILLTSKEFALSWLILQDQWNEFDFFGNVLRKKHIDVVLGRISFKKIKLNRVNRYTGYCRGYRESNTGAPSHLGPELVIGTLSFEEDQERRKEYQLRVFLLSQKITQFLAS